MVTRRENEMKNSNRNISKTNIMRKLAIKGLKAERTTVNGRRVWKVSDGAVFSSLRELDSAYKL